MDSIASQVVWRAFILKRSIERIPSFWKMKGSNEKEHSHFLVSLFRTESGLQYSQ